MEHELDSFILDIDLSNDITIQSAFMITRFNSFVKGKIFIIDFNNNWVHDYFTINESKSDEFIKNTADIIPKLLYANNVEPTFTYIENCVLSLDKDDLIIINGIEKVIENGNGEYPSDSDYLNFATELDSLYSKYQEKVTGIISILQTDYATKKKICVLLDKSNSMSIYTVKDYADLANKVIRSSFEDLLKLFDDDIERLESYLKNILEKYPSNIYILDKYCILLFHCKRYIEAAEMCRKIYKNANDNKYEIMARIYELLDCKGSNRIKKIDYVLNAANGDVNLENEALYRMAVLFKELFNSDYLSYYCLNKAHLELNASKIYEMVFHKLNILKDLQRVSKALGKRKPYKKYKDAEIIAKTRAKFIIPSIQILASYKGGYLKWKEFLEVQDEIFLKESAYRCLVSYIPKLKKLYSTIEQSYIYIERNKQIIENNKDLLKNKKQTFVNALKLINRIKQEPASELLNTFDSFENFKTAILTPFEYFNDDKMKIICLYYLSIIASSKGLHQDANNNALTILEFYTEPSNPYRHLALNLGLLAWGYSEYRIGRKVEGIMCIIASLNYAEISNEVLPFFEEGMNTISIFIGELLKEQDKYEKSIWKSLSDDIYPINPNMKNIIFDKAINPSKEDINNMLNLIFSQSYGWEEAFVTLVNYYIHSQNMKYATNLITKYGKEVYKLLEGRMDVRFNILYNWSWVYFCEFTLQNTETLYQSLYYIELSAKDIDNKRINVSHKEERGSIGKERQSVYKLYIDICCVLIKTNVENSMNEYLNDKIYELVNKLFPESIIEQKSLYSTETNIKEYTELKEKYECINQEYRKLKEKNADFNIINQKAKEVTEYLEKLKNTHPHYMSLSTVEKIKIKNIGCYLCNDEILYFLIQTKIGVLEIIASNDKIEYKHKLLDISITEKLKSFSLCVQEKIRLPFNEFICLIKDISYSLSSFLGDYLKVNNVKTMYYTTNLDGYVFSISDLYLNDEYIITKIESILRLIDVTAITKKSKLQPKISGILNRCLGKNSDTNISYIQKQIDNSPLSNFYISPNDSDNINDMLEKLNKDPTINAVCIYGHGLSNPGTNGLVGAFGIEGQHSVLDLADLLTVIKSDYIIVVSCSSGTPNTKSIEEAHGTLTALLERHNGCFVICKWDVDTRKTMEIINRIHELTLVSGESLSRALNIAQREMLKSNPEHHEWWAGLEMWIN